MSNYHAFVGGAVVGVVAVVATGATSAHVAPEHTHQAWTLIKVQEQFGADTTQQRQAWEFKQNEKTLWDAHTLYGASTYCTHSIFPWSINWENYYTNVAPPDQGWVMASAASNCHVSHIWLPWTGSAEYTMNTFQRSYNGNVDPWGGASYQKTCYLTDGALPPLWDVECSGYIF